MTRKKESKINGNSKKRSFREILHDLFEDSVFAFAMAYAGVKSDYETVRALENRLH